MKDYAAEAKAKGETRSRALARECVEYAARQGVKLIEVEEPFLDIDPAAGYATFYSSGNTDVSALIDWLAALPAGAKLSAVANNIVARWEVKRERLTQEQKVERMWEAFERVATDLEGR